jgi:hypothetical protein
MAEASKARGRSPWPYLFLAYPNHLRLHCEISWGGYRGGGFRARQSVISQGNGIQDKRLDAAGLGSGSICATL